MKVIRRTDLNIEDIRTNDYWNRFRIFSILNKENFYNKLDINALVELCLHSRESTLTVCKTFNSMRDKKHISEQNYDLNCRTYLVDNLPVFTYLKIANELSEASVKLRDWKYINRDTTFFVRIPKEIARNIEIRKSYESIQLKSIGNYREAFKSSNKNSRRYSYLLLPLGVQNRATVSVDIKENIELINNLLCSDMVVENQLGDMFEAVLKTDIKLTPDSNKRKVMSQILDYLRELVSKEQQLNDEFEENFKFEYVDDIVEQLITNFELLINPLGSKHELEFDYNDQIHIGNLISKAKLGNITKSKGSVLSGNLSLADIIDLLRFKYDMYIPLLSDFIDIDKELNRPNNECFLLPKELDKSTEVKKELIKDLTDIYTEIKEWRKKSREYMSEEMSKEFTRYLLPVAHKTRINMYLDISDIFDIRKRDLEYKEDWMKLFYQKDPLFKK